MSFKNFDCEHPDQISLKAVILKIQDWLRYLISHWIFILVFSFLGGMAGYYYAWNKKILYTAVTTFVLEEERSGTGISSLTGLASIAGIDVGNNAGGIFQGDNILELYKSRTMIERALLSNIMISNKETLLINRYIGIKKLRKMWSLKNELRNIQFSLNLKAFSRSQDSIISTIVNDINQNGLIVTKPDKKLSIIKAEMKSEDEVFAKGFNEKIVSTVNEFYIQTKTKKSLDNVNILQQKADSVRAVMNGAIYAAAKISDATPNLNSTRQIQRIVPIQRAQFSMEANKALLSEIVKNLELSKITLRKETPLIQVIDQPVFPLIVTRYGKMKWMLIGGIGMGLFVVFLLTFFKFLKDVMKG